MSVGKRKCKQCGEYVRDFIVTPKGVFCSIDSAVKYAYKNKNKGKVITDRAFKKETKRRRESIKTKKQWLNELQVLVNRYVRQRDANDGCISCDKPADWQGQWHAGHYYSRGHSSSLRFNLHNIHKQCSVCNNHLSGNIGQYTPRLIKKIGQANFDDLTAKKADVAHYDIDYIKRAIKIIKGVLG